MSLPFSIYIKLGKVKKGSPDQAEAKGLWNNGIEDFEKIKTLFKLSEDTANLIFKNVYDCLRSMLQAFLAKEGYTPYSHEAIIEFNYERGNITTNEANRLNKFRQLRNDISYRAVKATLDETKEIIKFTEELIKKFKDKM